MVYIFFSIFQNFITLKPANIWSSTYKTKNNAGIVESIQTYKQNDRVSMTNYWRVPAARQNNLQTPFTPPSWISCFARQNDVWQTAILKKLECGFLPHRWAVMRTIVAVTPLSFYIHQIHCFSSTYDKLLLFDVVAVNPSVAERQDAGNKLYLPYGLK